MCVVASKTVIVSPSATRTTLPWSISAFKARLVTRDDTMRAIFIVVYYIRFRVFSEERMTFHDGELLPCWSGLGRQLQQSLDYVDGNVGRVGFAIFHPQ